MKCQYKIGCTNKPNPKVNIWFCPNCDKERKEKITKQIENMVKQMKQEKDEKEEAK